MKKLIKTRSKMEFKWLIFVFISIITIKPAEAKSPRYSNVPGVVIHHSPATSGLYIGSPSICVLSNGHYIASHDYFGPKSNLTKIPRTLIYLSKNKGKTWKNISVIQGQFWSNVFLFDNALYIMGTDKQHGNVVIRRSLDEGYTWSEPVDESCGLLLKGEYHTAPTPILFHDGRIWRAMESSMAETKEWGKRFSAFMMSVSTDDDIMLASSWKVTNALKYDSTFLNGKFGGWLEGNAVADRDGNVLDLIRVENLNNNKEDIAAVIKIDKDNQTASFDRTKGFIKMPGGSKKFTVRYDSISKLYWTVSNYIPEEFMPGKARAGGVRNTLALCYSEDVWNWKVKEVLLSDPEMFKHTFSYVDWQFDANDIVYVSRTAFDDGFGGAKSWHDTNFITFHRAKDFRKFAKEKNRNKKSH